GGGGLALGGLGYSHRVRGRRGVGAVATLAASQGRQGYLLGGPGLPSVVFLAGPPAESWRHPYPPSSSTSARRVLSAHPNPEPNLRSFDRAPGDAFHTCAALDLARADRIALLELLHEPLFRSVHSSCGGVACAGPALRLGVDRRQQLSSR